MVAESGVRLRAFIASAVLALAAGGGGQLWASQPAVMAGAAQADGGKVYTKWCRDCHSMPTGSGTMALQRRYGGNPSAFLEQRGDLNADYVRQVVRHGISFMPSFRKTEISDAEVANLAAYLAKPHARKAAAGPAKGNTR
jgi:mono/diheme cytochrome c family protein